MVFTDLKIYFPFEIIVINVNEKTFMSKKRILIIKITFEKIFKAN
jgi:hypothetical protein